jgi:hypothetical protein
MLEAGADVVMGRVGAATVLDIERKRRARAEVLDLKRRGTIASGDEHQNAAETGRRAQEEAPSADESVPHDRTPFGCYRACEGTVRLAGLSRNGLLPSELPLLVLDVPKWSELPKGVTTLPLPEA